MLTVFSRLNLILSKYAGWRFLVGIALLGTSLLIEPTVFSQAADDNERPMAFGEIAKIGAADAAQFDQFGGSVAISGDYAVVGANRDDDYRGAAYVFVRSGSSWVQQQKLTASDATVEDNFGWSVAISGDTVVVGSYLSGGTDAGAAYIFVRSGNTWSQQTKLTASGSNNQLGISVAVDGDTALVGAIGEDSFRGAAYVFTRTGSAWGQQARLTAPVRNADDDFGWSVSLSGDSALVGKPQGNNITTNGSAHVFVRSGTVWNQQGELTASDGAALDRFGYSVAIRNDHAVVGAVGDAPAGSAYVFFRSSGSWSQQQKLNAAAAAANDGYGTSVAIDGLNILVGAPGADSGTSADSGKASLWIRTSQVQTTWNESQQLSAGDSSAEDNFGVSVALSGANAIVGNYLDDTVATDSGSAYIFNDPTGVGPTPTPTVTPTVTPTPTPTPTPAPTPTPTVTPTPTPTPTPTVTPTPTLTPTPTPTPTVTPTPTPTVTPSPTPTVTPTPTPTPTVTPTPTPVPSPTPSVTPTPTPSPVPTVTPTPSPTPTPSVTPTPIPTVTPTPSPSPTPTPSVVSVEGRVFTPAGLGIRNAIVRLTDPAGNVRIATTSSFGFYSFTNIPAGAEYTISVQSKRYRFAPRIEFMTVSLTNVDFFGLE